MFFALRIFSSIVPAGGVVGAAAAAGAGVTGGVAAGLVGGAWVEGAKEVFRTLLSFSKSSVRSCCCLIL